MNAQRRDALAALRAMYPSAQGAARSAILQAIQAIDTCPLWAALEICEARMQSDPANAEFWRRLAGSLRKARAMI